MTNTDRIRRACEEANELHLACIQAAGVAEDKGVAATMREAAAAIERSLVHLTNARARAEGLERRRKR